MGRTAATSSPPSLTGSHVALSAFSWCSWLHFFRYSFKVSLCQYRYHILWANSLSELTERGARKALLQLGKQFMSISPAFEVFATRISSHSITSNLIFGGARYIATGRGFATTRISFSILFSRFAGLSIYLGMRTLIMLLYVTMTLWIPWIIYFWVSILALCVSPFLFNPHQFSVADFFIDYR